MSDLHIYKGCASVDYLPNYSSMHLNLPLRNPVSSTYFIKFPATFSSVNNLDTMNNCLFVGIKDRNRI
jgi:hypothetical protein